MKGMMMQTSFSNLSLNDIVGKLKQPPAKRASQASVDKVAAFMRDCGYRNSNEKMFNLLCKLGASELEGENKRGLFIKGDVGVGKTIGLELLAKYLKWELVTAIEAEGYYKTQPSYEEWEKYCRAADFFGRGKTLVIDDLGTEKYPFTFYGQQANPLEELLEIRYRISYHRDHMRTIVTCNLTDDEIRERYGFRIFDRMNEMFAIVTVQGESLRK